MSPKFDLFIIIYLYLFCFFLVYTTLPTWVCFVSAGTWRRSRYYGY